MRRIILSSLSLLGVAAGTVHAQTAQGQVRIIGGSAAGGRVVLDTTFTVAPGMMGRRILLDTTGTVSTLSSNRARIGISVGLFPNANDAIGAVVEEVTPKGPADRAGLQAGDIITKVNDVAIGNTSTLGAAGGQSVVGNRLIGTVSALKPGVAATLQVRRGKETLTLKVTPERDDSQTATMVFSPKFNEEFLADSVRGIFNLMMPSGAVRAGNVPGFMTQRDGMLMGGLMSRSVDSLGRTTVIVTDGSRALAESRIVAGLADSGRRLAVTGGEVSALERGTRNIPAPLRTEGVISFHTSFDALSRLDLAPVSPDLGSYFGTTEGVLVVSIAPPGVLMTDRITTRAIPSPAAGASARPSAPRTVEGDVVASAATVDVLNLKAGDVILAVDGRKVATPNDLMRILRSYQRNDDVKLTVMRQKKTTSINTKMPS